jgi:hypothetical protein
MKETGKFTSEETEQRRDAALKRALSTPHKPHKLPPKKKKAAKKRRPTAK